MVSRDKLAPAQGLMLALVAFVLLFLGWLCTYLRTLNQSGDSALNLDGLAGYGRHNISRSFEANSQTTIIWPPLQEFNPDAEEGYPKFRSLLSLVSEWNPDKADPPKEFRESLQHFNYSNPQERAMAEKYRNAELPFKLYDVPDFARASALWTDDYLVANMDSDSPHVEESHTNHFMYWNTQHQAEGYKPPTEIVDISFKKWLTLAHRADEVKLSPEAKHYYFMTASPPRDRGSNFISRDLPLFSTPANNFFITDVRANKGIQCRFGMRGIIAEAHYDSGRNMVAMLKGEKRYILSPPRACRKLGIISDTRHPSFRHSIIDWSDPEQAESRGFRDVDAIDTILRQGEVLYIPSYYFHYIVSLRYSIQCNSRSGSPPNRQGESYINECFGQTVKKKMLRSLP